MDRAEAEAIYDSGRGRCVEVILELAGALERGLTANALRGGARTAAGGAVAGRLSYELEASFFGSAEDSSAASGGGAREG